jgi:4-hydroxybenzoate polyprenyltransferase
VLGAAQLAAARDPRPATVQKAVGTGVLGLIPLEGALLARGGAPRTAAAVAVLWPVARRLSRRVSAT